MAKLIRVRFHLLHLGAAACLLLTGANFASAQYGPMGIGNADGSEGQPKLLLWLDGSTPGVASGQDVLLWPDKSGNGNDFSADQATSPVLRTSSGPNGKPYLEFSRADNRMALENLEIGDQGISVFYVVRTSDGNYGMFSYADASEPRKVLVRESGGQNRFTVDGDEHQTNMGSVSNGTWRHVGFIWDGVTNPTYWHRSNGTNNPESTQNNVLNGRSISTTGTAIIGHIQNSLNCGFDEDDAFQGDIAEIFVYEGKVNRAMLRMTNSYFRAKYNIGGTGGWDKLEAPSSYRETPILIGRDSGSDSEHRHSRSDGLVLRANPGGLQGNFAYVGASHNGVANTESTANLPTTAEARWSRDWFIRKDGLGNSSDIQIGFSFGEGINGEFPTTADNYVLLYRSGTSGNYSIRTVNEVFIQDDEVVFRLSGSQIANSGYYTLGTTNNLISNLTGAEARTWYAFQSGNWDQPTTWTLDGSAAPTFVNPGGDIPAAGDAVVVGSGRTVTCNLPGRVQSSLHVLGTVDFGETNSHNMGVISGNGTIRCAGDAGVGNFPGGNAAAFSNPNNGGQVVFYGSGFTQNQDLVINRLRINLNNPGDEIILAADLTTNGLFEINKGTFKVNNGSGTSRTVESHGNVLIEPEGRIRVSNTDRTHTWTFHRDLINEGGDIRFTNRTAPNYTQEDPQRIVARFVSPSRNQRLVANGTSYFSRIVMNKGNSDTYILTVSADSEGNFGLFGRANQQMSADNPFLGESTNEQRNAMAMISGTLEIRENVFLPLHYGNNNYNINETVTLWVNGGVTGKGPVLMPGAQTTQAIVPYGTIRVSAGTLRADCRSGITTRANGLILVEGGEVYANQIRTSVFGPDNVGGLIINGGLVDLDASRPGGTGNSYYTLSLTYPGNLFRMTGGELRVAGPTSRGSVFINSDPQQTSVSGGTVILDVINTSNNYNLTSRAPFWNLEIRRSDESGTNRPVRVTGGQSDDQTIDDLPLIVRNSLTISGTNNATLRMLSSSGNVVDARIQGNMTIGNGGVYDHQMNTTYFDGGSNSLLYLPFFGSTQNFGSIVVDKNSNERFARIQTGNGSLAMTVSGDFRLERGIFDNNNRNVRIAGDVINRSTFGTEQSTGLIQLQGPSQQELISDNGIFHNLWLLNNSGGVRLVNGDITVRRNLRLQNCRFFIGSHKVRVEGETGSITYQNGGTSAFFITDGSPGAGGLESVYRSSSLNQLHHMAVEQGAGIKYTPVRTVVNENLDGSGLIRIVPVDKALNTANLDLATDYLDFHWKVFYSEFDTLPKVSHEFRYQNSDVNGSAANFTSGRVLFDDPFSREIDSLDTFNDHVNTSTRWIFFNGPDVAQSSTGEGRTIANAAYTAGNIEMFQGRPQVFFSRNSDLNADFNTGSNWNELGQFDESDGVFDYHSTGVSGNTEFPQEGDIAFIGFDPATGRPHSYQAPAAGVTASEVRFTPLQNISGERLPRYYSPAAADLTLLRPTFSFESTSEIENIDQIIGEGTILLRGDVDLTAVNLGDFVRQDSAIVMVESQGSVVLNHLPAEVPNLFLTTADNGSAPNLHRIASNIRVRGDLEIVGNAKLNLSNGTTGNLRVDRDLKMVRYQAATSSPEIRFNNASGERTVEVFGNLVLDANGAQIRVTNPNSTPQLVHNLIVHKDIYQNTPAGTGLNLFTNVAQDFVALTLKGSGNHSFINDAGGTPQLGLLTVDKGNNLSSGFSFNSEIKVEAPADGEVKPVELLNGLLTINDSNTDITLSSGAANFSIPSTAGLALEDGTLRITGNQIGMNLGGLLRIDGGLFEIGDSEGENNYIEYSSGGSAKIEVNGGSMEVGSQLRRGLTNPSGILDYRQTGGAVRVGIFDAPDANRGVFEIVNDGSRFDFTGGSLTLVRGVNSNSVPSLLLEPALSNVSFGAELTIGDADSPSGAGIQNIGIRTAVDIPSLYIGNESGNNPVAKLLNGNLVIDNELTIDGGATLETQFFDLTVRGDIHNDGLLESDKGKLILDHTANTLSGTGTFELNDLDRIGGGVTILETDLLINGNFSLDGGIMTCGSNAITAKGAVRIDGDLEFSSGEGLIMSGSGGQMLRRSGPGTSLIDILTTDNPGGITQMAGTAHNFIIGKELRMKRGIFNLNGNLLQIGADAVISQVNAFGSNNMISTGGALTNFGVKKFLAPNTTEDLFIPLGLVEYMPIRLVFSDVGYSSGNAESSYLFKLIQPSQNAVLDPNNVLQMYFSVQADNVGSGMRMNMELFYDENYVALTGGNTEEEYIGARIVDNSPQPDVFKFGTDAVNTTERFLRFTFDGVDEAGITGDYFAGIEEAIPDNVPVYTTERDGNVNEGEPVTGVYDQEVPGGGSPNGAIVNVVEDHELSLNVNGVTLYKTIINENATLIIDETGFHRLGIVEGTGTIRLVNTGNLPNGIYNDFLVCEGGKIEFAGDQDYEVLANLALIRGVTVSGTGTRTVSNNDVNICQEMRVNGPNLTYGSPTRITVDGDVFVEAGTLNTNQGDLDISGDLHLTGGVFTAGNEGRRTFKSDILQSGGTFGVGSGGTSELRGDYFKTGGVLDGGSGSGCFVFNGNFEQTVNGDFTGSSAFRMLEIENPAGVRLNSDIEVSHTMVFTDGKIFTAEDSLVRFTNAAVDVIPAGGRPGSFVNGPVQWILPSGFGAAADRLFPVGKGNRHRPLKLSGRDAARTWTVEYYDTLATTNPAVASLGVNDLAIETISIQEYWRVNSNSPDPTVARVGLSWGENSAVAEDPGDYDKLVALQYDPVDELWASLGAASSTFSFDAVNNIGSFLSASNGTFSESFFTLGSSDAINPLPVTWLAFTGTSDGRNHTLDWSTASEINNDYFELERSVDGRIFTPIAKIDGSGNSNSRLNYSYTDKMAPVGRVYYRLRQVDFNGDYAYAPEIVTLVREEAENEYLDFLLYPNPSSTGSVRLMLSDFEAEMVLISVADLSGQILSRKAVWIDEQGISDFIPTNHPPGAYIVSVLHNNMMKSKPLIITR